MDFRKMEKVLHLRIEAPTYSSLGIEKGFKANNFEYYGFDWQLARFSYGTEAMREMVIQEANKIKPDIIFAHTQNPDAIDLDTYIALQKISKVIFYTFDVRSKEKSQWMYEVAKNVHYSFFGCQEDVDNCEKFGIKNCAVLQSSCDIDVYKPFVLPANAYIPAEIVFIGNNFAQSNLEFPNAQERVDVVNFLQKEYPGKFKAWGLNWPNSKMAGTNEEVYIYNACKIAIVQNNYTRNCYQSDRVWKALSCGAFVLAKSDPGLSDLFSVENHLDVWANFDDLKTKIDYYLEDELEAINIAECGCNYVRENHAWPNRVSEMMKFISND